jgi:nicotinamide-nucleotide amidase
VTTLDSARLDSIRPLARQAVELLARRGESVATAESLTGGLVAAALTTVPGASVVVRGALVAYATDLKAALLGVPPGLLERCGAVHPDVAAAMAAGVRDLLGASVGVGTTGVAGPDPADGQPVGTVYVAIRTASAASGQALRLAGDRDAIRNATVWHVLQMLVRMLTEQQEEQVP